MFDQCKGEYIVSKNIKERRKESANVPENNRAEIVSGGKQKRSVGRIILLVVIIVALIAAIALAVVNFLIRKISEDFITEDYRETIPTINEQVKNEYKAGKNIYSANVQSSEVYKAYRDAANTNYLAVSTNIMSDENVYNYGIYGVDSTTNDVDVIVIASINKDTGKISYVLLDDEMLVAIPYAEEIGYLEDAYGFAGANLLSRTISANFGVEIHGYIELDMTGLVNLANSIGGVEINMTAAQIVELNKSIVSFNEKFAGTEGFTEIPTLAEGADRTVLLENNAIIAYVRGETGMNSDNLFNVLFKATEMALKDGVSGVKALTDSLKENAKVSSSTEDFSTLLELVARTSYDENNMAKSVLAKDKLVRKYASGVNFTTVEDYSAMVKELQNLLYPVA